MCGSWIGHYVMDDPSSPTGVNYHTHGFLNHPDIQIVLPIKQSSCAYLAGRVHERIVAGEKFKEGDVVSGISKNFNVTFIEVREMNRMVLRLILPAPNGALSIQELVDQHPDYSLQWNEVPC